MQVYIPNAIARYVQEWGLDISSLVIELLVREFNVDPEVSALAHLELATRFFQEGVQLIDKDPIQASEKLYKVAEECIKALSEIENLEEARRARERGRWTLPLLDNAARRLGERICEDVYYAWTHAYFLHVEGFHECRINVEQVRARLKYVQRLLEITERVVKERTREK